MFFVHNDKSLSSNLNTPIRITQSTPNVGKSNPLAYLLIYYTYIFIKIIINNYTCDKYKIYTLLLH